MGFTSDKGLAVGFGLLVALLAANAVVAYRDTRQLHDSAFWVSHTHEVLGALEGVLSAAKDAETGQRGFLITGEDGYLNPYEDASLALDSKLAALRRLTADNSRQQDRIPRLRQLVQAKLAELARTVALRKGPGFEAARELVLTGEGKETMDALRAFVGEMRQEELGLLRQRQEDDSSAYLRAVVASSLGLLLGVAAVAALFWLLRRHLKARAKAAAALHEQRELLHATLTSIGDGVIATDAAGHVTFLNPVAEELTGWPSGEARGRHLGAVFQIVNEDSRLPVEDPARKALAEGRVIGLANHTVLLTRGGAEWPIDDCAAPIRAAGGAVTGAVLVFREVSRRRRQEAELRRQAEALAEAGRRKDEFLAMLGHELRNPLAALLTSARVLRVPGVAGRAREESLDRVERQLQHLHRLVNELLEASRVAHGKVRLSRERLDLARLARTAAEDHRALMGQAGLALVTEAPEAPVWVQGDPTRLAQVLANLLDNAAKFSERGGVVRLEVRRDEARGQAIVSVRDQGVGIAPEDMPHLFTAFAQAGRGLDRAEGGLGLGLAVVKALVELHAGEVSAASAGRGRGTEVTLRLPAEP